MTGLGETYMYDYRNKIVGLEGEDKPLNSSWGFEENNESPKDK
jgi:hypothetical protein